MGKGVAEGLRNAKHDIEWFHERFARESTDDTEWIPIVSAESMVILTKDLDIRRVPIEAEALYDANARCFMFPTKNQNGPSLLLLVANSWAEMEKICATTDPPFLYRVYGDGTLRRKDTGKAWDRIRAERATRTAASE